MFLLGILSCTAVDDTQNEITTNSANKKHLNIPNLPFNHGIQSALYKIPSFDLNDYDSVTVDYFHAITDYTNSEHIKLDQELKQLEDWIYSSSPENMPGNFDSIIQRMSDIKAALATSEIDTTGYVFLHTFKQNNDTLRALIICDAHVSQSKAIIVKQDVEIEPQNFKGIVRDI